jgi:uncharacterized membrane protein required for colicin V production
MTLPNAQTQCFFVVMLVFIVLGFQRGWRRELVSLVSILLAYLLGSQAVSNMLGQFLLQRLPNALAFMVTGVTPTPSTAPSPTAAVAAQGGGLVNVQGTQQQLWPLLLFALVVALGYYISIKAFPKPSTPQERWIGIVPAVISGAFVLAYLNSYFQLGNGNAGLQVSIPLSNPTEFVPVLFFVIIVALVVALIVARAKKAAPKK